ncbi:MAG: hypothetical protein JWO30_2286 [Fibrobacteres bacterium]|nr:hypothetical protein [Fibrobacterota bacterium]
MRPKPTSPVPWGQPLKLLPLLAFFAVAAVLQSKGEFEGDGWRYLQNARNLLHGFFASPETLMFWNGPGYPLVLTPFLAFHIPLPLAHLANAVFLYLAVVHFQGTLRLAGVEKRSLAYAYAMAGLLFLHGPLLGMIMTESLSAYLVCGAAYHYCRAAREPGSRPHLILAGLHLGYLALTKVFFGYVLEVSIPIALGAWLWARGTNKGTVNDGAGNEKAGSGDAGRTAWTAGAVCALGLLVCAPYLAHTWAKTGKANLWGNAGGFQLYYMSLPEKEYYGDWLNFEAVLEHPEYFRNHVDFLRETLKLDFVSQDGVFKQAAVRNCREHPGKCILNWRANVNRMVFGFPNTYYPGSGADLATGNRAFVYAFPFALCLLLAVPGWLGRRTLPAWIHACLAFACISLGGMSLVCAIPRQVFPLLPMLGLWCAVVVDRTIRFQVGGTGDGAAEPG